jgi:hypothetical protein
VSSTANDVYLFWDNSNIFIPAKYAAAGQGEIAMQHNVRAQFDNLFDLARGGRRVVKGYCVGSVPPELRSVWDRLRATGLEVEVFERGADSHTEQAVDQALQVRMLRTALDTHPPAVAVLLTGDGAGYDEGVGFRADLERLHREGWGVEVIAWDSACSYGLKTWAGENGVYLPLERFYRSVTFVQGGRPSETLSMKGRGWAKPRE